MVSDPSSRWFTIDRLWLWRNSIGSSTVTMCSGLVRLMMSINEARVVDLPEPVGPVTRTRPCRSSVNIRTESGMPSVSNGGISWGMARKTPATVPRCWKTFSRKRPTPGIECEVSSSFSASNFSRSDLVRTPKSMSRIVSLSSWGHPSMGRTAPCSLMQPGMPAVRCRSDAPTFDA